MDYKTNIKKIKELLKAKQYDEALQLSLALRQEYQRDTKLHKLINKIKVEMRMGELHGRENFIKEGLKTIRKLRRKKEYEKAIQACDELLEVATENKTTRKLRRKIRIDFIELKLKDPKQKEWRKSKDYEKLYLFYQKLKKVFPHYTKLNRLIYETEQKMIKEDRSKKKVFAADSLKKLRQMHEEGKYEAVIEGADELSSFTHAGSSDAKKLYKKAQKANRKEIERDTVEHMKTQLPLLKAAYAEKPEGMIKI